MRKKTTSIILLMFVISVFFGFSITSEGLSLEAKETKQYIKSDIPHFENVVFVTWDGASGYWIKALTENGTLVNTKRVADSGYMQIVRVTSHKTSTDPGLATMESGYGPAIHGIDRNMFGGGSAKLSIPDGYSITERLKASDSSIKSGFILSWEFREINSPYIAQEVSNNTDSTFDKIKIGVDVDYWFDSSNLTWIPGDPETASAVLFPFNEEWGLYPNPLLKADYLADRAVDFINNVSSERFYLRMHLTEPDQAGHGYGESNFGYGDVLPEYMQSLVACDQAMGKILDALESAGVLDETLVVVGADHGMFFRSHDSDPWPGAKEKITKTIFAISNTSVRHNLDVPAAQRDVAPTILASMGVDLSTLSPAYIGDADTGIPFWDFTEDDIPSFYDATYKTEKMDGYESITDNTKISGIFNISLSILEWSPFQTATLAFGENVVNASASSSRSVVWYNLDSSIVGKGKDTFHFTLTDVFGNTLELDYIVTVKASFSLWISIGSLLVIGSIIYIKKRKKI
ncbi:MAG: sulfatase-like hydrolase/transferase [Candidatus Heimdallarchaeota archaeon]